MGFFLFCFPWTAAPCLHNKIYPRALIKKSWPWPWSGWVLFIKCVSPCLQRVFSQAASEDSSSNRECCKLEGRGHVWKPPESAVWQTDSQTLPPTYFAGKGRSNRGIEQETQEVLGLNCQAERFHLSSVLSFSSSLLSVETSFLFNRLIQCMQMSRLLMCARVRARSRVR